ncbi:MAG: acetaldehyde dehydrogenase (acetylating) [Acidobacteria bacterium]|nr:MAG: acetaldehyde dehydrogenase (acetylating) [Acidobacteriota bacterium]
MDKDLQSIQEARECVEKAHQAQKALAEFSQEKVDAVVEAMAEAGLRESERLARLAVEETGYGRIEDKILKNKFGSQYVYNAIKDLKTVGIIREDPATGIIEIASPVGVVAAIIPSTNPTSTTLNKALIALKSRNAIVFSPHPSAANCIRETAKVLSEAAEAKGAPEGIIQCMSVATIEGTQELMKHRKTGLILATGGHGLVRAAYSAGKPAYGVGPGNVPAYIESSADIRKAVNDIFAGKCFDHGTLCSSEQAIITDEVIKDKVIEEIKVQGGYFLNDSEIEALGKILVTPTKTINPRIVGRAATIIAGMAGIRVPEGTRVLVGWLKGVGRDFPLSIEKLSPILAFYVEKDWRAACDRCIELLNYGGLGHTLAIHSRHDEIIRQFGLHKPVFRIVVNTQAALGAVGYTTNLFPSMTLGCGSLGGNITSDNISPLHLMNIKRIAYESTGPRRVASPVVSQPHATAEGQSGIRHQISDVVEKLLAQRNLSSSALSTMPSNQERVREPLSAVPATAFNAATSTEASPPKICSFVCEDDVRLALRRNEKIYVDAKSIVTPSARDLGTEKDVLVFLS